MFTLGDVADILDTALDTGISIVDALSQLSDIADDGKVDRQKCFHSLNIEEKNNKFVDINANLITAINYNDNVITDHINDHNKSVNGSTPHLYDQTYYQEDATHSTKDPTISIISTDVKLENKQPDLTFTLDNPQIVLQREGRSETFVVDSTPVKSAQDAAIQGIPIIEALGDLCNVADNFLKDYNEANTDNVSDERTKLLKERHTILENEINDKVNEILESFQRLDYTVDQLRQNAKNHSDDYNKNIDASNTVGHFPISNPTTVSSDITQISTNNVVRRKNSRSPRPKTFLLHEVQSFTQPEEPTKLFGGQKKFNARAADRTPNTFKDVSNESSDTNEDSTSYNQLCESTKNIEAGNRGTFVLSKNSIVNTSEKKYSDKSEEYSERKYIESDNIILRQPKKYNGFENRGTFVLSKHATVPNVKMDHTENYSHESECNSYEREINLRKPKKYDQVSNRGTFVLSNPSMLNDIEKQSVTNTEIDIVHNDEGKEEVILRKPRKYNTFHNRGTFVLSTPSLSVTNNKDLVTNDLCQTDFKLSKASSDSNRDSDEDITLREPRKHKQSENRGTFVLSRPSVYKHKIDSDYVDVQNTIRKTLSDDILTSSHIDSNSNYNDQKSNNEHIDEEQYHTSSNNLFCKDITETSMMSFKGDEFDANNTTEIQVVADELNKNLFEHDVLSSNETSHKRDQITSRPSLLRSSSFSDVHNQRNSLKSSSLGTFPKSVDGTNNHFQHFSGLHDRTQSQPILNNSSETVLYRKTSVGNVMSKLGLLQQVMSLSLGKLTQLHAVKREISISSLDAQGFLKTSSTLDDSDDLVQPDYSDAPINHFHSFSGSVDNYLDHKTTWMENHNVTADEESHAHGNNQPIQKNGLYNRSVSAPAAHSEGLFNKSFIDFDCQSNSSGGTYTVLSPTYDIIEKDSSLVLIDVNESDDETSEKVFLHSFVNKHTPEKPRSLHFQTGYLQQLSPTDTSEVDNELSNVEDVIRNLEYQWSDKIDTSYEPLSHQMLVQNSQKVSDKSLENLMKHTTYQNLYSSVDKDDPNHAEVKLRVNTSKRNNKRVGTYVLDQIATKSSTISTPRKEDSTVYQRDLSSSVSDDHIATDILKNNNAEKLSIHDNYLSSEKPILRNKPGRKVNANVSTYVLEKPLVESSHTSMESLEQVKQDNKPLRKTKKLISSRSRSLSVNKNENNSPIISRRISRSEKNSPMHVQQERGRSVNRNNRKSSTVTTNSNSRTSSVNSSPRHRSEPSPNGKSKSTFYNDKRTRKSSFSVGSVHQSRPKLGNKSASFTEGEVSSTERRYNNKQKNTKQSNSEIKKERKTSIRSTNNNPLDVVSKSESSKLIKQRKNSMSRASNSPLHERKDPVVHTNFLRRTSVSYGSKETSKNKHADNEPVTARLAALRMQLEEKRHQFEEEKKKKQLLWSQERAKMLQDAFFVMINGKENEDPAVVIHKDDVKNDDEVAAWEVHFNNTKTKDYENEEECVKKKVVQPYESPRDFVRRKQEEKKQMEKSSKDESMWFVGFDDNVNERPTSKYAEIEKTNTSDVNVELASTYVVNVTGEIDRPTNTVESGSYSTEVESIDQIKPIATIVDDIESISVVDPVRVISSSETNVTDVTTTGAAPTTTDMPALKQTSALKETPALEQTSTLKEAPVLKETPALKEIPALKHTPTFKEITTLKETPALKEIGTTSKTEISKSQPELRSARNDVQLQENPLNTSSSLSRLKALYASTSKILEDPSKQDTNLHADDEKPATYFIESHSDQHDVRSTYSHENLTPVSPVEQTTTNDYSLSQTKQVPADLIHTTDLEEREVTTFSNIIHKEVTTVADPADIINTHHHDQHSIVEVEPDQVLAHLDDIQYSLAQPGLSLEAHPPTHHENQTHIIEVIETYEDHETSDVPVAKQHTNDYTAETHNNVMHIEEKLNDFTISEVNDQDAKTFLTSTPMKPVLQKRTHDEKEPLTDNADADKTDDCTTPKASAFSGFSFGEEITESLGLTPEQQRKRDRFLKNRLKRVEDGKLKKEAEFEKKRKKEEKLAEQKLKEEAEEKTRQERLTEEQLLEATRQLQNDTFSKRLHEMTYNLDLHSNPEKRREAHPPPLNPVSLATAGRRTSPDIPDEAKQELYSEYKGPAVYQKPSGKSNRKITQNAIMHCCLCGEVNKEAKRKCLEALNLSEASHFLVLFREGLKFRSVYEYRPEIETVTRIYGIGPKTITPKMMDKYLKYNSGGKAFNSLDTKHLSIQVDGIMIKKELWEKKAATSKTTTSNIKKRPPMGNTRP